MLTDDGAALLPPIIAHRGASGEAPENTLAALALAADQGIACVEIDVSISADGVPFVHHDDTLERCTNGQGLLCELDAAELDRLDASKGMSGFAGEPLPRLSAVFDLLIERGVGLNLEIKPYAGLEEATVNAICTMVEQRWPPHLNLLFSSFSWPSLALARERMPQVPRGLLTETLPNDWQARIAEYDCRTIHCNGSQLRSEQIVMLREAGLGIYCYTVNDVTLADRLFDAPADRHAAATNWTPGQSAQGVHGIFTDYPQLLDAHLSA